jgi:4-hydroxybenzoate polyprenyltransferase
MSTTTPTDIRRDGWVGRLPAGWRPYALLMRLDRPIGTWLLLLPGWWSVVLASGIFRGGLIHRNTTLMLHELSTMLLFGAGAVVMRGAGCIVNDLWDRDLDRQVARTAQRPLAAGTVSRGQAALFMLGLLIIGFLILLQLSIVAIFLGILSLPFIALYPAMKRITWWPQAFLGLTFNFGALMGYAAVTGVVAAPALVLYAAGFFWTLGYDTIYAHQDIEDDMRVGIRSTALRLGRWNRPFVAGAYAICWLLLETAFFLAGAGLPAQAALALPLLHMLWQLKAWRTDDPESALSIFRSNRDFGLLVLLAAIL